MLAFICAFSLLSLYVLATFRGRFWIPLKDKRQNEPTSWPDVDVIIPARNEAEVLKDSLATLFEQDYKGKLRIILVDDHSTDGTRYEAEAITEEKDQIDKLLIINAPELPEGWSGKVAAMHAGLLEATAPYILFTDADIAHKKESLSQLVATAQNEGLGLTSRMVQLSNATWAEKLMIPAFVFFFAMLYPFRLSNNPKRKNIAAAAGGVMLTTRQALDDIGGLESIKDALIDDCSLARKIKDSGHKTQLTLTKFARSARPYPSMKDIMAMISRTAFTQLRHSYILLIFSLLTMAAIFVAPAFASFSQDPNIALLGQISWLIMTILYAPMILFYGQNILWAFTLPLVSIFYIIATATSALHYIKGQGGQWKGRSQAK